MAQTIRKQSELLDNLENNNNKNITPEDIRDVVVSTNGPIMIWSGKVYPYRQGIDGIQYVPETTFMNPFYFNTGEGTQGTPSTVWQITNSTVTGAPNGTYTATSTAQGNFKAKVTVSNNTVTSFEILDPGYGQRNRTAYDVEFYAGGTRTFQMTYNGAVHAVDNANNDFYFRGKGGDNSYHTPVNSFMHTNNESDKGEFVSYVKSYGSNVQGFYINHDEATAKMGVSIWKVIGA
jgi:hypothetical protein